MYTLQEISQVTGAQLIGDPQLKINSFFHDSRNFFAGHDSLFIALSSARNDGHDFIPQLASRGLKAFLIKKDKLNKNDLPEGVSFLIVKDPLQAIQQLAASHRKKFSIPVIGITGSNGKTIVKEWLYHSLKSDYSICRSPKSYNSQIGVPLSVLGLREHHTLAIFEAGISQVGEMEKLAAIIDPTIGILTSLGTAHDEGFRNQKHKLKEKLKLFNGCRTVIINGDFLDPSLKGKKVIRVSPVDGSDVVTDIKNAVIKFNSAAIELPLKDEASVLNAGTCAALLQHLDFPVTKIREKINSLHPVALRLEIKNAVHNSLVINDFYNSDLDSLRIALNFMQRQNRRERKVVILSDIEQSGIPDKKLYPVISELIDFHQPDLLIGIGKNISSYSESFGHTALFYPDTFSFVKAYPGLSEKLANATILLKGARSFGFERVSELLQLKSHDTVFEINLSRITNNINYYRSLLAPNVKLMCMVKATGYGSGSSEIARTLEQAGVSMLAVAYADEGVELRNSLIRLPVMVMSPEESAFEDMINHSLEPELYSFRILELFSKKLDDLGISEPYPVHIKIDTGMHRLGFGENEIDELIERLKRSPQLKIVSVFSHLAASDNPALDDFTGQQIRVFDFAWKKIEQELGISVVKHLCNSAGITRFRNAHYDLVRLGIGMYGIGSGPEEQRMLQNAGTLKTRVSQIKSVSAGETVGYNRAGVIDKQTRIATIPLGYADGFSRQLGNGRHGVYIKGIFCKTIGSICMDMCMVDVSGVHCSEGDEVIIFENVTQITDLAKAMNTIPYEVLTNVSSRVKRVYVEE